MSTPPSNKITESLVPLLQELQRSAESDPEAWVIFAVDAEERGEFQPGVRWLLTDPSSPLAGGPAHGRAVAIEWLTVGSDGMEWTAGLRKARALPAPTGWVYNGRIRLRVPRPRKSTT